MYTVVSFCLGLLRWHFDCWGYPWYHCSWSECHSQSEEVPTSQGFSVIVMKMRSSDGYASISLPSPVPICWNGSGIPLLSFPCFRLPTCLGLKAYKAFHSALKKWQDQSFDEPKDYWPFHPPGPAYDAHLSLASAMAAMLKHDRAWRCIRHWYANNDQGMFRLPDEIWPTPLDVHVSDKKFLVNFTKS